MATVSTFAYITRFRNHAAVLRRWRGEETLLATPEVLRAGDVWGDVGDDVRVHFDPDNKTPQGFVLVERIELRSRRS